MEIDVQWGEDLATPPPYRRPIDPKLQISQAHHFVTVDWSQGLPILLSDYITSVVRISSFFAFWGFVRLFNWCFVQGPQKRLKFGVFRILPGPVGSHTDCLVSWDILGGIRALRCQQGPPQTGFGVAEKRCTGQCGLGR